MDGAYQAKYLSIARLLWQASEGDPSAIPGHYARHLDHTYVDGDISLVSLLPKFEYTEELGTEEFEEVLETLSKVSPNDWPSLEDIESVNAAELYQSSDETDVPFDFVEDNLGLSEKVSTVLKHCIESVFGDVVSNVRSKGGGFPGPDNKFLQEADGTFAGTFKYHDNTFDFEVFPTEGDWLCTYRMSADSLDKLPPVPQEDDNDSDKTYKRMRSRGW